MKWQFCDIKGNPTKEDIGFQVDTVGNIYQHSGAVKSKACQKCKKPFDYKPSKQEIIQQVPLYECLSCDFKNSGANAALDHKIETDHKIKKTTKDRIVGYDSKIFGSKAIITKTKTDIKILCGDCNA